MALAVRGFAKKSAAAGVSSVATAAADWSVVPASGDLVVIVGFYHSGTNKAPSFSALSGNTALTTATSAGDVALGPYVQVGYFASSGAVNDAVCTATTAAAFGVEIHCFAISGATAAFDSAASIGGTLAPAGTLAPSVTIVAASTLLIGGMNISIGGAAANGITLPGTFTSDFNVANAVNGRQAGGHEVRGSAGATARTFTATGSGYSGAPASAWLLAIKEVTSIALTDRATGSMGVTMTTKAVKGGVARATLSTSAAGLGTEVHGGQARSVGSVGATSSTPSSKTGKAQAIGSVGGTSLVTVVKRGLVAAVGSLGGIGGTQGTKAGRSGGTGSVGTHMQAVARKAMTAMAKLSAGVTSLFAKGVPDPKIVPPLSAVANDPGLTKAVPANANLTKATPANPGTTVATH